MRGLTLDMRDRRERWRRLAAEVAPFSPADLWPVGVAGFWAPVTFSRLWQDIGRTLPVTLAGQSVASWELSTALGPIYAQQSTEASRPVAQVDADNCPYLDLSGNKWMVTPAIAAGSDKAQIFAAFNQVTGPGAFLTIMEASTTIDSNSGVINMLTYADGGGLRTAINSKGTVSAGASTVTPVTPNNQKVYRVGLADIAAPSVTLRENGVQIAISTASQGTGSYGNHQVFIGARGGTGLYFSRPIYGLALRYGPNLAPAQIANMEAWLAGLINP